MQVFKDLNSAEPLLISANQAAQSLCISPRYLYELSKDGVIPAVRIGRRVMYRREDLRQFVEGRAIQPGTLSP